MKTKLSLMLIMFLVLSFSVNVVANDLGFANQELTKDFCDDFLTYMVDENIEKAFDKVENE
jgi:hypothetical protein